MDKNFINDHLMGPNALKIIEELTSNLMLEEGMKVLDLGCGKGLTSFFLAEKYKVQVYSADLWIDPSENYQRAKELGLEESIIPIRVDANEMPFANDFFDAIISIDAFQYFCKNSQFIDDNIARLLKANSGLLVAIPGINNMYEGNIPKELQKFGVVEEYFHSPAWWEEMWLSSSLLIDIECSTMLCHDNAWNDWLKLDNKHAIEDREMMAVNQGKYLNLIALKAKKI